MKKQQQRSKSLHITLWIAQVILAAMFLMSGLMKVSQPIDKLSQMLPCASQMPAVFVCFVGAAEVLGALGLILPSQLRIQVKLTPIAAVGLSLVMLFAVVFHLSRGETSVIGMNFILIAIAAFIAWGRFNKAPIAPKTNRSSPQKKCSCLRTSEHKN
jgi:putative oxidoreductase